MEWFNYLIITLFADPQFLANLDICSGHVIKRFQLVYGKMIYECYPVKCLSFLYNMKAAAR